MLLDFEPLEDGPSVRSRQCSHAGCDTVPVVGNPYTGAFKPLCFHHAFVAALQEDPQAQRLAVGYAVAEGLKVGRGVEV